MAYVPFYNNCDYEKSNQGWQVRVHIASAQLDTRNPLNRVQDIKRILKEVFKNTEVELKIYEISDDVDAEGYNGILNRNGSDRTQVGKEVCIYMPNSDVAQLSAEEYKNKLLLVWKRLQEANIELMYQNIPGDKAITTLGGSPTPFSFTSQNPHRDEWRDDHGILFKKFEAHGKHPILDVTFGLAEIHKQGIRYNNRELQATIDFLSRQANEALENIGRRINAINEDVINTKRMCYRSILFDDFLKTYIKRLAQDCKDQNLNQRQGTEYLFKNGYYRSFANNYPHNRDSQFTQHAALGDLAANITTLTDEQIDKLIDKLKADYDEQLVKIKNDLLQIGFGGYFPTNLVTDISPAEMQKIFRRFALLKQEARYNDPSDLKIKEISELTQNRIEILKQYKKKREADSPREYLGLFGSIKRLFNAFTKTEKFEAVDALITCLIGPNAVIEARHLAPLKQGRLNEVLKKLSINPNEYAKPPAPSFHK